MAHIFSLILLVMGLCIPVHAYAAECQGLTTEPTYLDNGVSPRETYRPTESLNLASHGTYIFMDIQTLSRCIQNINSTERRHITSS